MTLVFNTAEEVSLGDLSQRSGVTKPTLKRYLEYLEAAFLIKIVHRIDRNAKRFKRTTSFKVYVTSPALRCALFGPVAADDPEMGSVAETAVFAQWFHSDRDLHYARWRGGEVDIVHLDRRQRPTWCVEVKWSDRYVDNPHRLKGLAEFARLHPDSTLTATTRNRDESTTLLQGGFRLDFIPTSVYCYVVGYTAIRDPAFAVPLVVRQ